mmetsp:Transcript_31538/g.67723  ORF Transcript_31538/g.67723 Transcript_31538/m.67723 type:complete len:220 (+) Transcript_31538:70-729(+)
MKPLSALFWIYAVMAALHESTVQAEKRGEIRPPSGGGGRGRSSVGRDSLSITTLEEAGSCQQQARTGDIVSFEHSGFVHEAPGQLAEQWNGRQIDQSPQNEPLKVKVGQRNLIRGMDLSLEGLCVGQKISVIIPPQLAFDDPEMKFDWNKKERPCPQGSSVRYDIKVLTIHSQGGASFDKTTLFAVVVIIAIFATIGVVLMKQSVKAGAKPAKEKKKRR